MTEPAPHRHCSKQLCRRPAVCTLTYVYSDSTAVIGALSERCEPHAYDLCVLHADRLTAPRGWRVVRLESADGGNREDLAGEAAREEPAARRRTPEPRRFGADGRPLLRDVSLQRIRPEAAADDGRRPPRSPEPFNSVPLPPALRRAHLRRP